MSRKSAATHRLLLVAQVEVTVAVREVLRRRPDHPWLSKKTLRKEVPFILSRSGLETAVNILINKEILAELHPDVIGPGPEWETWYESIPEKDPEYMWV